MLNKMNKTANVKQQYSDDKNLAARLKLHAKHSTNKQGFGSWLREKYVFSENYRILELGCGNGAQWENKIDVLPKGCNITLSDLSDGMVNAVKEKYEKHQSFAFKQIDIQDINFPDETFDVVVANHMLYHVPDLVKAFSEVKRVLKVGGKIYAATNGNRGLIPFLHEVFKRFDPDTKAFTHQVSFVLQNGYEMLIKHFSDVKRLDYEDSLSITETQDLMDWIKSTITASTINNIEKYFDDLFVYFEDMRKKDGAINIPKEVGVFISTK